MNFARMRGPSQISASRRHRGHWKTFNRRSQWKRLIGDATGATIVLLGGGLLGSALFPGPEFLGPAGEPFGLGPQNRDSLGPTVGALESTPAMLILLIVPALLMFLRRSWPIAVFVLTFAGFIAAVLLGLPSLGPGIAATISAFAFAFRVRRSVVITMVFCAVALDVLLAFAATGWESLDSRVFQIGAALTIAAVLGDNAQIRHENLLHAEERAHRAEQTRDAEIRRHVSEERLRIARDLHDTVAHQISVINLHAGAASGYLAQHPDRAQAALATIRDASRGALSEIGNLLRFLREDDGTDTSPPQRGIENLDELLDRFRESGLDIALEVQDDLSRVTGTTAQVAYRVIQEGLTNAHKHGEGHSARLSVKTKAKQLHIEIENPLPKKSGKELKDVEGAGTGLGLIGLRERVASVKGMVMIDAQAGRHRVEVTLPLPKENGAL